MKTNKTKEKQISIRLSETDYAEVTGLAGDAGVSAGFVIRNCIDIGLPALKKRFSVTRKQRL